MLHNLEFEKKYFSQGYSSIAGVDEVGRGPLAGPVVAACVVISTREIGGMAVIGEIREFEWVRDSKKVTERRRELLATLIKKNFVVGIGVCDNSVIDSINILQASLLAMKIAIARCEAEAGIYLVDGNKALPDFDGCQAAIIGGDARSFAIAAASIVAKVERDAMMAKMHEAYPQYGFDRHKGYGTKGHLDALRDFGPCPVHRRSFGPVSLLGK